MIEPSERDREIAEEFRGICMNNYGVADLAKAIAAAREEGRHEATQWRPIETAPVCEDVMLHSPDADQTVYVGHRFGAGADEEWYPQHETTFNGGFFEVEFTRWRGKANR